MKKSRFIWRAFLPVFAGAILALVLVSCNGEGEHPEHPTSEGTQSEHPEHPK